MLVELTKAAESDVGDAAIAYELERRGLGFRFEEEVDRVLAAIEDNARQYQVVSPDVRRALVRVFPYSVYFTIMGDRTRVFAGCSLSSTSIASPTHGRRAIDEWIRDPSGDRRRPRTDPTAR